MFCQKFAAGSSPPVLKSPKPRLPSFPDWKVCIAVVPAENHFTVTSSFSSLKNPCCMAIQMASAFAIGWEKSSTLPSSCPARTGAAVATVSPITAITMKPLHVRCPIDGPPSRDDTLSRDARQPWRTLGKTSSASMRSWSSAML